LRAGTLAIEEIELELPRGVRCADVDGDIVGAVCEDDDIDQPNDDDDRDDDGDDVDDDGDDDESKVVIRGPFLVDLVSGTSEPSLADVRIPAATYARIDIEVDESPALNGRSFVGELGLTRADNSVVTIAFGLDVDEEIRIEHPQGVAVAADAALLIDFVVDDWFAGADLGACIDDGLLPVTDGHADLGDGDDVCGDIEDLVEANMEGSLDLGVDTDDDDDDGDDDSDDDDDRDDDDNGADDNGADDNDGTDDNDDDSDD
ncbi:MAG TPA: hypothetical protein VGF99_11415, partial [Myxococcota bacterium]